MHQDLHTAVTHREPSRLKGQAGWAAATRRLVALTLAAIAMTSPFAHAAVPMETAEAVVSESGLAGQLVDAQRAFTATIDQTDAASLPADVRDALKRAGAAAFDPARLRAAITKRLAADLDPAHAQAALDWWRSPQGRQIIAIEAASSRRLASDAQQAVTAANAAFEAATPLRKALLTAMERATRSGEMMADGQIRSADAMMETLSTIMARPDAEKVEAARRQLESQRPQIVESMRGVSTVMFALTYSSVDDAALASHLAFALSPAGRGVLDATYAAFIGAWLEGVAELTRSFPRMTRRGSR